MPKLLIFSVANMSFNTIRENKILAKISGFTVAGTSNYLRSKHKVLTVW